MRLSHLHQKRYPKFTHYLRTDMPKVARSELYFDVYNRLTGITRTEFREMLAWGHGPTVVPAELDGLLGRCKSSDPDSIYVSRREVEVFEAGILRFHALGGRLGPPGRVHYIGVIIFHELAHWADSLRPVEDQSKDELGKALEGELFGMVQAY